MNRIIIGVIVVVFGVLAGWYIFGGGKTVTLPQGNRNVEVSKQVIAATSTPIAGLVPSGSGEGLTKGGVMESASTAPADATKATVSYSENGFTPKTLTVKVGTAVTFVNNGAGNMWVASAVHPTHQLLPGFDQLKSVGKGGKYEYVFSKVGTWKYHNHVNPSDTASVVVTN